MEIQKVSGQTFQRRRFISADAQKNLNSLLGKMNKESSYPHKDSFLDAKILSGLKVQNSHFVKDLWDNTSIVAINNKTDKNFEDKTLVKRRYIKMPSLEEAQNFIKMLKELHDAVIHKCLN